MTAAAVTPVLITSAPTVLTDLTTGPATSAEEWVLAVRVTNKTTSAVTYRLLLQDTAGANLAYRAYDYNVDPKDSVDIETALVLANGYKLRHLAGTGTALEVSVTGRKRATT